MQSVHSWDLFDTLLARTVEHPTDIFSIIENTFPFPNFKRNRILAEKQSDGTIAGIYNKFQTYTNISDEIANKLRAFELETEKQHTIPIMCNVNQMKKDDIIVSDMYFTPNDLKDLLSHHGIHNYSTLYVSWGGKYTGKIWDMLIKKYNILKHTGDNKHSDIYTASLRGIKGILTDVHKFTDYESKLIKVNPDLCNIFRRFRLSNPYEENSFKFKLYDYQIKYNIPILLTLAKRISQILEKEHRDTVLFLTRDCCLLIKIFRILYPQYKSIETHSSRIVNKAPTSEYVAYLKTIYNKEKCLIVDLHGSFNSARNLFMEHFHHLPRVHLFSFDHYNKPFDGLTWDINPQHGKQIDSWKIEGLNSDIRGTLCSFKTDDIRMPLEYNIEYVILNHETVDTFCNIIKDKQEYFKTSMFENYDLLEINFKKLENLINFNANHTLLTALANKYKLDKGNKYLCAHNYIPKYEEIFDIISNKYKIWNPKILEIGLNRANTNAVPSLNMWNDYFSGYVDLTGFDIQPNFLKFKKDNINIIIGDQSNESDLEKLKDKMYHVIIDDGYHASKHQQITFKMLWNNVLPGGFFIIEDLHYKPEPETCISTQKLFESWLNKDYISTEFITDVKSLIDTIESIEFIDSEAKYLKKGNRALLIIRKQR